MAAHFPFPPNFLWGTASASHQVEGNNTNNQWWAFEQQPGAIWHGDRSGLACDWWRDAEDDFERMAGLGLNAHRLSLEWSRIEPEPGRFDPVAIDRYRELLDGLQKTGVERVDPAGETFDPGVHEAVATRPDHSVKPGQVLEVLQPCYRMADRLIRPARVIVAAPFSAAPDAS